MIPRRIFKSHKLLPLLTLWAFVSFANAAPRFAHIFADHAVLQRDQPVTVWGTGADPDAEYQIRYRGEAVTANVEKSGDWHATLPKLNATKTGRSLELIKDRKIIASVEDVVVGEVWLAAGQSNMQFRIAGMVKGLPKTQTWVDSANHDTIRFRRIDDKVLADRKSEAADLDSNIAWVPMTPETVLNFSAIAAVFATEIGRDLDVPIGIVDVSWGGKPIEPFIPREAFSSPFLQGILALADADKIEELKSIEGGVFIRNPEGYPGAIFNARMAPITSYGLRGFLWYQAESNAGTGEDPRGYRHKMEALFRGWRKRWENESLPCYFVQLPGFPRATGWIRAREEQRRALDIPNTGMAVTIDLPGEDIHPPMKIPVGQRLAKLALANTYQKEGVVSSSPIYRDHEVSGREVRVHFSGAGGGLKTADSNKPLWFELAGSDGKWHSAKAEIEGETVVVTSDKVDAPVAVRYACATYPRRGLLFNAAGLPASPFCSDLDLLPWIDASK